jgi:hypothetical protein
MSAAALGLSVGADVIFSILINNNYSVFLKNYADSQSLKSSDFVHSSANSIGYFISLIASGDNQIPVPKCAALLLPLPFNHYLKQNPIPLFLIRELPSALLLLFSVGQASPPPSPPVLSVSFLVLFFSFLSLNLLIIFHCPLPSPSQFMMARELGMRDGFAGGSAVRYMDTRPQQPEIGELEMKWAAG